MDDLEWTKYESTYRLKTSYAEVFKFYLFSILKYRNFIWVNFLKHFKASFRQSYFSLAWKVIIPLVPVSVYVVMQFFGILKGNSQMPFALSVVVGMTFWQLFSSAVTVTMNAPDQEKAMLKKINIPFLLFYISSLGAVIFDYLIRLMLIWALLIAYQIPFTISWILLPLSMLPILFFGAAVGIFISFFSIFFHDIRILVDIVLRYGLFISGVLFPITGTGKIAFILGFNPMLILIDNLRSFLVFCQMIDVFYFSWTLVFIFSFMLFTLKKLYSLEPRLREFL